MPTYQRSDLLEAAHAFCSSYSNQPEPSELLSYFSSDDDVLAYEHGLQQLSPFYDREYRGREGIREYFEITGQCVSFVDMSFSNYVVDSDAGTVAVRGKTTLTWKTTGQAWDEVFMFVLAYSEDLKIKNYDIWGDSGALYLASKGQL